MSDGEWMLLAPEVRWVRHPQLTLTSTHASLNVAALRVIDMDTGGQLELAVRSDGTVSIRPARPGVSPTVTMTPHGKFGALAAWARAHGYEPGKYRLDDRDGSLFCRLRKMGVSTPS